MSKILIFEGKKDDAIKRLVQKFPNWEKYIKPIMDSDPTGSRYILWIEKNLSRTLSNYEKSENQTPEERELLGQNLVYKFEETLPVFSTDINKISPKFLENFKNFQTFNTNIISDEELQKILKSPRDIFSYDLRQLSLLTSLLQRTTSEKSKARKAKSETNFIFNDGNVIVVQAKTHKASCYYGANTKWCTTSESPDYFNKYTKSGDLYYVIDKKNRREKMAVYIPKNNKGQVEVYNTTDSLKNLDFLFRLYPEIEDTLDDIIGTSSTLTDLKKLKNDEYSVYNATDIDPLIYSASRNGDDPKTIMIKLQFDGDNDFWNLWDDWDDYNKFIVDSLYSHYSGLELFDSYSDEEDWKEGYGFYWFNDEQLNKLKSLLPYFSSNLAKCADKLTTRGEDEECKKEVAEFLQTTFERKVDDIISEHNYDREHDAQDAMKNELDKDYKNMFAEYGMPMSDNNFYTTVVTLHGLLKLYQNFDPVGKLSIFQLLKKVVEEQGIDRPNLADNMYEYSSPDYEYESTSRAIDNLLEEMENDYSENMQEYHPEYNEYFELVKKLGGLDKWIKMPGDERYSINLNSIDAKDGTILFSLQKGDGKIKKMKLPFENFKDFIYNQLLFDI